MRVQAARAIRVGPGDGVVVRGQLPASSKLGRLFIFASEGGAKFSPYVRGVADMVVHNGMPPMLTPLSLRLVEGQPVRQLSFVSDIDGFICVMQEVDTPDEPRAKVRLTCRINPELKWNQRLWRKLQQWQRPKFT